MLEKCPDLPSKQPKKRTFVELTIIMNSLLMIQHNNQYLTTFDWHQKLDVCLCFQLTTHLQTNAPKIVGNAVPFKHLFITHFFHTYIWQDCNKRQTNFFYYINDILTTLIGGDILTTLIEFTHSMFQLNDLLWSF